MHCLTDDEATSKNIRQAFADISAEAGAGCSVLVVFDMSTVEIQGGPEAGFYFCPHDYRCEGMRIYVYACVHVFIYTYFWLHIFMCDVYPMILLLDPFDMHIFCSNANRRGSGIHTDELIDWAGSLRSACCSMFITTVYIGSKLDSDAQVLPFARARLQLLTRGRSRQRHTSGRA